MPWKVRLNRRSSRSWKKVITIKRDDLKKERPVIGKEKLQIAQGLGIVDIEKERSSLSTCLHLASYAFFSKVQRHAWGMTSSSQ